MTNIGILGGTFDTIHHGHTLPARAAAAHLSLDEIVLIPASIPPHKATPNVSAIDRATMVKLACSTDPLFRCDERELTRDGYSYTVDTIKELANEHPDAHLYFIIGLDSLLTFTTWHNYQEILSFCHLLVNTRPNYQLNEVNAETKKLLSKHLVQNIESLNKNKVGGIFLLPNSLANYEDHLDINVSSSEIRERLINKQAGHRLLNPHVLDFINKNKLYR
jgi:nicotinate-nucleotide adenylyltransferase